MPDFAWDRGVVEGAPRLVKTLDDSPAIVAAFTGHRHINRITAYRDYLTVLCWYNCAMKGPEETVFPAAQAANTGVVIMNASRNEKLLKGPGAPAPEQCYRYVLCHDAVHTTVMGLRSVDLFARVAASLSERETITPEERAELESYGAQQRASGALE